MEEQISIKKKMSKVPKEKEEAEAVEEVLEIPRKDANKSAMNLQKQSLYEKLSKDVKRLVFKTYLDAESLVNSGQACKLWHARSKETAKLALRRYLPVEVINTLANPLATLHCFNRLFSVKANMTRYGVDQALVQQLRYNCRHSSALQHILCYPYNNATLNDQAEKALAGVDRDQLIKVAMWLHNVPLVRLLQKNAERTYMGEAAASGNMAVYLCECRAELCDTINRQIKDVLSYAQHPAFVDNMIKHAFNANLSNLHVEEIKSMLINNSSCFYSAKNQAPMFFPKIDELVNLWKIQNLEELKNRYEKFEGNELDNVRIAILLTGDVDFASQIFSWDCDSESDKRIDYSGDMVQLFRFFAIYHNDYALFCRINKVFSEDGVMDMFECLRAIARYGRADFYPWLEELSIPETLTPNATDELNMLMSQCDISMSKLMLPWLASKDHNDRMKKIVCESGRTELIQFVFEESNPDQEHLCAAVISGNPEAVRCLIQLNPDLKAEKTLLYIAANHGHVSIMIMLIDEYKLEPCQVTFNYAVVGIQVGVAEWLTQKYGFSPDVVTKEILSGHPNIFSIILSKHYSEEEDMIEKDSVCYFNFLPESIYLKESMKNLIQQLEQSKSHAEI